MADLADMQVMLDRIRQNQTNSQAKANEFAEKGNAQRAAVWEASAARYASLAAIKEKLMDIQERTNARNAAALKPKLIEPQPPTPIQNDAPVRVRPNVPRSTPSEVASSPAPVVTPPPPPVKTAPIDTILFDNDAMPIEVMSDLIFENIGGQELIDIARTDTVNGQKIVYQPIKNLSTIQNLYNPNNILSLQQTSEKYFQGFSIKLEEKIPDVGNGPNGENIYIEPETGDLIIEVINMSEGEQVESQISITGTIYEGTL